MDYSASIETSANVARAAQAIRDEMNQWWSLRVAQTDTQATIRFRNSQIAIFHGLAVTRI